MDGYCEIGSTSNGINMYDREAIPLSSNTHSSNHYSSPIHSPTSTVPPCLPHTNNHMYNHHMPVNPYNAVATSASQHREDHQNEQSSTSMLGPGHRPPVRETSSPTEGVGMIEPLDDNPINPEGGNLGQVDSSNQKQAFVQCKVCGDKASGYHYGVTSCEGCKGFFRRSIQKQIEYRCLRDGKCLVIRLNRNRCQYCRFKKCLAVGMSRDSVRYGRVPKRSKSVDQQPNSTTTEHQDQVEQESRNLAIYDIILNVSQAHHSNCLTTDDKAKQIVRKNVSLEPMGNNMLSSLETMESKRCMMFQVVTGLVTQSIQNVVEFAKRIPDFNTLSQDDQLVLIKSSFTEVWLTHLARQFDIENGTMMFSDGSVVAKPQLEMVFNSDIVNMMFSYSQSFSQLALNDTEIGLYTAIVMTTADRLGLLNTKSVEQIQERLIEALKLQLARNHASEPNLFSLVMMKLPELRTLGAQHNDLLDWYRHRWQRLALPPLYAEIFDIPKSEEDLHTP